MKKAVYKQKLSMKKVEMPLLGCLDNITCSRDSQFAASLFWDKDDIAIVEHFYVLYLNRANYIVAYAEIGKGGIDGVVVDKRIVFTHALLAAATGMILFHNHPSGNLKPSERDITLTRELRQAGDAMGIKVYDHLIVTPTFEYYSFTDEGII